MPVPQGASLAARRLPAGPCRFSASRMNAVAGRRPRPPRLLEPRLEERWPEPWSSRSGRRRAAAAAVRLLRRLVEDMEACGCPLRTTPAPRPGLCQSVTEPTPRSAEAPTRGGRCRRAPPAPPSRVKASPRAACARARRGPARPSPAHRLPTPFAPTTPRLRAADRRYPRQSGSQHRLRLLLGGVALPTWSGLRRTTTRTTRTAPRGRTLASVLLVASPHRISPTVGVTPVEIGLPYRVAGLPAVRATSSLRLFMAQMFFWAHALSPRC